MRAAGRVRVLLDEALAASKTQRPQRDGAAAAGAGWERGGGRLGINAAGLAMMSNAIARCLSWTRVSWTAYSTRSMVT